VTTPRGTIVARAIIITASTSLISSGKIKFTPELPRRHLDAMEKLSLGSYDHIALELSENPLALQSDDLVFEKSTGTQTAAILGNVSNTPIHLVEVAGSFGRTLSAQGENAMTDFALDWLTGLYGADVRKAVKRTHATRWNNDPWTLGAFSVAAPGAQGARRILAESLRDVVWFAGEAMHETLWGTVGGAWESGDRAADAALRKIPVARAPLEAPKPVTAKPMAEQPEREPKSAHKVRHERVRAEPPQQRIAPLPSIMQEERR
jgi:monoamine oxidase